MSVITRISAYPSQVAFLEQAVQEDATNAKISLIREKINYLIDTPYTWKLHKFFHIAHEDDCVFCSNQQQENAVIADSEDSSDEQEDYASQVSYIIWNSESGDPTENRNEEDTNSIEIESHSDAQSVASVPTTVNLLQPALKLDELGDPEKVFELLIKSSSTITIGFNALYDLIDGSRHVPVDGSPSILINNGEFSLKLDGRRHVCFDGRRHVSSKMMVGIARKLSPYPLHDCMKSKFGASKIDMHQLINAFLDAEGVKSLISLLHSVNAEGLTPIQAIKGMQETYPLQGSSGFDEVIAYLEELTKEEAWLLDTFI